MEVWNSAPGSPLHSRSLVVFRIHSRSQPCSRLSANQSGQEVHEDEQRQVEKDEEPEIQPVGVFRKPVHPRLNGLILVPPSSCGRAPPLPDTIGTRRRLAHLHLHVASLSAHLRLNLKAAARPSLSNQFRTAPPIT